MKSKVEQYAKGDFYVEYPKVTFSKSHLQLKIESGSVYNGSIDVVSENDVPMKMMVYDDAYLLRFREHSVIGKKGTIEISFDASKRKKGSTFEGNIYVIGDGIEKKIPYNIEVVAPFIDAETISASLEMHEKQNNAVTVITAELDQPKGYGRIIRTKDGISGIVEEKDASAEQREIKEVNSGAYWFRTADIISLLGKIT